MIKALLIDLGGIIVPFRRNEATMELLAEKYDVSFEKINAAWYEVWKQYERDEISLQEFWRHISNAMEIHIDESELCNLMSSTITDPIEGSIELLEQLKGKYLLVLVNNVGKEFHDIREQKIHFEQYFDCLLGSFVVKARKPEKRYYERVLQRIDVPAEHCVFIDDKPRNIEGAEALGICSILFKNADQLREELVKLGVDVHA